MKEKVLKILQGVNESITDGINLIDNGIVDSFDVITIVTEIEEAFNIEIDPEDVVTENFETVDRIVAMAEKYLNA